MPVSTFCGWPPASSPFRPRAVTSWSGRRARHHHRPGPAGAPHLPRELREPRCRTGRPAGPHALARGGRRQTRGGRLEPSAGGVLCGADGQGLSRQPAGRGGTVAGEQLRPRPPPSRTARTTVRCVPWWVPRAWSRCTWTSRTRARMLWWAAPPAPASREFLQSWVMGMATAYSPDRVSFLFVDYKGGAAFADCVHLPHTRGPGHRPFPAPGAPRPDIPPRRTSLPGTPAATGKKPRTCWPCSARRILKRRRTW